MMNADLPAGIEAYLKEAGFTSTEMLVLKRLVEEDALTLREIAAKTGKSTGVLDQATKKLIVKNIVVKKMHNAQPRYSLHSLDAVVQWVQKDMKERKNIMERKHQSFENYISTLKFDKGRPDIQYYSGLSGIEQAYLKLLETGEEILTTGPVLHTPEEDPMRECKVDLFRKRQYRKIFQRIIAPDSPVARRFQSRDPFEYRKTLLVPPETCPFPFEKTIAGEFVACIDVVKEQVSFIRFPELAKAERASFELEWQRAVMREKGEEGAALVVANVPVALKTRILSCLREFFLSRRSLVALLFFAIVAGGMTFGLYKANRGLNLERLKERVLAIAVTGALQFEASDIQEVWLPEDQEKPEYANLVATLRLIRRSNENIQYAYLMRASEDPAKMMFIADADSAYNAEKKDLNKDGRIDNSDALNFPGEFYPDDEQPLIRTALQHPFAAVGSDQWGTFVTGHAPVYDKEGKPVAVLGVDMFSNKIDEISAETFAPVFVFIVIFFVFAFVRFWAVNRSLLLEIFISMRKKIHSRRLYLLLVFLALVCILFFPLFGKYSRYKQTEEIGKRLMAIAVTAVSEFDPKDLDEFHFARDMKKESYQKVFKKLNEIRNKNVDVTFAYFIRPTEDPYLFEFIADADASWSLPTHTPYSIYDKQDDGEKYENVWPGVMYYDPFEDGFKAFLKYSGYNFYSQDQWGSGVTGGAPIIVNGKTVAILVLDYRLK